MRGTLLAVLVLLPLLSAQPARGQGGDEGGDEAGKEEIDQTTGLVVAPGWELVRAHCGGCHSHQLVTGQRADRQTWLDIIRWMQATQNLWQLEPAIEAGILDYLAANYPPQPSRRRAPIPPTLMPPPEGAAAE